MAQPASAQLVAAITANQTVFGIQNVSTPAGSVGFPPVGVYANPQQPLMIDSEIMYIVVQNPSGTIQVRSRGAESTAAAAHDALANIYTGLPTDFGPASVGASGYFDPNQDTVMSIGTTPQTLSFAGAVGNITYNINTATAATITLPNPLGLPNGTRLTFTSNTANAHVLSAPSLIQDGAGTLPHSTITFTSKQGAGVVLVVENGLYNVPTPSTSVSIT